MQWWLLSWPHALLGLLASGRLACCKGRGAAAHDILQVWLRCGGSAVLGSHGGGDAMVPAGPAFLGTPPHSVAMLPLSAASVVNVFSNAAGGCICIGGWAGISRRCMVTCAATWLSRGTALWRVGRLVMAWPGYYSGGRGRTWVRWGGGFAAVARWLGYPPCHACSGAYCAHPERGRGAQRHGSGWQAGDGLSDRLGGAQLQARRHCCLSGNW